MFTDHDLEQGVVLGVGVCEYAPVPLRPLSIPSSIYDFVEHEASPEDLRVDGTRFGDPSSTIRALGSCQWMLGDLEKLCSFLGPPDFRPNEETLEEKARFQNTVYMCEDSGISMHTLHDEYVFDPSDHTGTKGLWLSSEKEAIRPSSPQNNRVVDLREDGGEQKLAYNDKDHIGEGYIKERYTDIRLIQHEELMRHQRHSRAKYFSDCLECGSEEVQGAVRSANYIILSASTLSIGLRRFEGGKLPTSRGGSDGADSKASAKDEAQAEGEGEGGLPALVPLLEQCIAHNKAVVVSFVGATLSFVMRGDFMMLLQYTDFLFITERECRRAAILLYDNPDMDLRASARALSTYTKISNKRPRVVVVLPNAPLPIYSPPARQAPTDRHQGGFREKYDSLGRPAFDRFIELDRPCHDNDQELRTEIDPDLPVDGARGFSTSLASVSELLAPHSTLSPGAGAGAGAGCAGGDGAGTSPPNLHSASVLVMSIGEEMRVPVQWPEPDEATGISKELLQRLGGGADGDDDLLAFSDLFYGGGGWEGEEEAHPQSVSFTGMHSFYYNQAGAAFLPRRPYRAEITEGMRIPSRSQSQAQAQARSRLQGDSSPGKEGGGLVYPISAGAGAGSKEEDNLQAGGDGAKGSGSKAEGKDENEAGMPHTPSLQARETHRKAIVASQAAHTAQCDIFTGAFLALVVRAEASINAAHQRLLNEQAARSFVRETVPDIRGLESAAARSKRLQRERQKQGISDGQHRQRVRTAQLSSEPPTGGGGGGGAAAASATNKSKSTGKGKGKGKGGGGGISVQQRRGGGQREREADTRLNRRDLRRGLTQTQRQSLFQGPESRMRNADMTTMVEVDASRRSLYEGEGEGEGQGEGSEVWGEYRAPVKPSVRAMGVSSWGDDDNAENEYSSAGIKWEDAPLSAAMNVVTGKRLLYDCVAAGCYALAHYEPPVHNRLDPTLGTDRVASPLQHQLGSPPRSPPMSSPALGAGRKGGEEEGAALAPGGVGVGVGLASNPSSPGSRLGTARVPQARAPCGFWKTNTDSLEAAIEAAAMASYNGTSVVSNASTLRGIHESTLSLHDTEDGGSSVASNFSDSTHSPHWSSRRRLAHLV